MSRMLRLLGGVALALVLLWGLAWLAVPPLLKWQLETRGSELLGRELRVDEVRFAPATLALSLQGLRLAGAPGDADATPQLQIDSLRIDLDARSLLRLAPVVEALEVQAPRLRLARLEPGRYDIDDLLQRFARPTLEPAAEPQRFALFNLQVSDGSLQLDDRPVGRKHVVSDITLGVPFLSNLPSDVQVKVEPRLAFRFNGGQFDQQGHTTPFAKGRASELVVRFEPFDLAPLWAYLPGGLPARPEGGRLAADLKLRFEQPDEGDLRVELQGDVSLREFALHTPAGAPLLSWRTLALQLSDVRPLQQQVRLGSVQLDGAVLHLRRQADGTLELQTLAEAAARAGPRPGAKAAAAAAPQLQLQIDQVALQDATLRWSDASLQPAAELQAEGVGLALQSLRWPVDGETALRSEGRLVAQGQPRGAWSAEGALTDHRARIAAELKDLDIALAEPYLRALLRPQASARVQAAMTLDWADGDDARLRVGLPRLRVDDFRLTPEAPARGKPAGPLAQLARLELSDLQADLLQQRLSIGTLRLLRPAAELSRDAEGRLSVEDWLRQPPAAAAPADSTPAANPWQLQLRELGVEGGRLRLADAALPAGPIELDQLQLRVQGVAWPAQAPWGTQLALRLALPARQDAATAAARLDWRGRVGLQPPSAEGQLRLERFPVHVFEPYFGAALPVVLQRLEAGYQGSVAIRQLPQGPSAQLRGDALLADLKVLARGAPAGSAAELLSWNALNLNRMGLALQPGEKPRIEIGELRLADFFSRLEINEQGQFNLQNVAAKPATAGTAAPAAAPAPALAASAPDSVLSRLPVELLIEGMQFSNGRIDFNDRFVRPNYRADLSELNGRIGRLDSRSRDMATLDFSGRVAGTGLLEIGGALNPTVIPPALDIKAKAHDIELPGLTPYSAKYAGYPIERGKLSVDVAYKIESDGKLEASNQIIVNQLTFGPRTDSPDATKLPVPLVVALLQDKNGVIDLDLPLTGSVSDPQFSIGALIWKVIVNLFTKAVSSPFSVIGGGGGKDLSVVEFSPGTAQVAASGNEVLAKVAQALADRPGLKLGIVGTADAASERQAMQRAAFEARLRDEQRRESARGALGRQAVDGEAPLPPLTAEQRARLVAQLYDDTRLPDKPRNAIGMAKSLPGPEMEAMLVAAMPVDEATARQLAVQRARTVRDTLVAKGLGSERLFLGEVQTKPEAKDNGVWVPQAQLSLSPR